MTDVPVLLLTGRGSRRLEAEALDVAAGLLCRSGDRSTACNDCRRVARREHPDLLVAAPEASRRANTPAVRRVVGLEGNDDPDGAREGPRLGRLPEPVRGRPAGPRPPRRRPDGGGGLQRAPEGPRGAPVPRPLRPHGGPSAPPPPDDPLPPRPPAAPVPFARGARRLPRRAGDVSRGGRRARRLPPRRRGGGRRPRPRRRAHLAGRASRGRLGPLPVGLDGLGARPGRRGWLPTMPPRQPIDSASSPGSCGTRWPRERTRRAGRSSTPSATGTWPSSRRPGPASSSRPRAGPSSRPPTFPTRAGIPAWRPRPTPSRSSPSEPSERKGAGRAERDAPRPVPSRAGGYFSSSMTTSMAAPGFDSTSTVFVP